MPKRNVCIVLFSYTQKPHLPVANALYTMLSAISARGWGVSYGIRAGDGILPRARNSAVSDFLWQEPHFTDLVMIDDDNWCDADGMLRLLDAPVDLIGAPCRSRGEPLTWPVRWKTDGPIERDPYTGLVEVDTVGTGIIRVTRDCLDKMAQSHGDQWYVDSTAKAGKSLPLFMYEIADRAWWGEDVTFCKKWRAMGGAVWIEPDVLTHHIGLNDFQGHVGDWLVSMPPKINIVERGDESSVVVDNTLSSAFTAHAGPQEVAQEIAA